MRILIKTSFNLMYLSGFHTKLLIIFIASFFSTLMANIIPINQSTTSIHNKTNIENNNKTRPHALILATIPLLTIFGNGLVILAVYQERSLQTVTNFLIVSLAVSDFLVSLKIFEIQIIQNGSIKIKFKKNYSPVL